jgi:uncharacterized protein YgiM (DUF1202 family)
MGAEALVKMRSWVMLGMLALGCAGAFAAAPLSPAAAFDQANRLYEQGRFLEAAQAYEALIQAGLQTPNLYFNYGNAAYKAGHLGRAVAAYRKAERLEPRDAALRANLQFVRGKIYPGERARTPLWLTALRTLTVNEWTALAAGCTWALFAVLACGEWAGRRYTRSALALLGAALLSGAACFLAWRDATRIAAVVVAREAAVRFGPLDESQVAYQLRDGAELAVLGQKNDWLQVRDPEARTGWIRRDEVAVIPPLTR